jgi:hypothetical protein
VAAKIGLTSQQVLLKHLISDTEEDAVSVGRQGLLLRKIVLVLVKTLSYRSIDLPELRAQALRNQWNEAYAWLSEREQEALSLLARSIMNHEGKTFQERLEQAVLRLITEPSV